MTQNPARALHDLLSGPWRVTPGNTTTVVSRNGHSWDEVWQEHVRAAGWVHQVRDRLEALGQFDAFEGTLVAASRAVFSVDRSMLQATGGVTRHISDADLRALNALALVLDGQPNPSAGPVDPTALVELLQVMGEAKKLIFESPELTGQTKQYLLQVVAEFEQSLGSIATTGSVDPLRRLNEFVGAFALAFDLDLRVVVAEDNAEGEASEKQRLLVRLQQGGKKAFWLAWPAAITAGFNLAQNQLPPGP